MSNHTSTILWIEKSKKRKIIVRHIIISSTSEYIHHDTKSRKKVEFTQIFDLKCLPVRLGEKWLDFVSNDPGRWEHTGVCVCVCDEIKANCLSRLVKLWGTKFFLVCTHDTEMKKENKFIYFSMRVLISQNFRWRNRYMIPELSWKRQRP